MEPRHITAFFAIYLVVSLTLGTIIGDLGIRALRTLGRSSADVEPSPADPVKV